MRLFKFQLIALKLQFQLKVRAQTAHTIKFQYAFKAKGPGKWGNFPRKLQVEYEYLIPCTHTCNAHGKTVSRFLLPNSRIKGG